MYDVSIGMMTRGLVKVRRMSRLEFPFERFLEAITERTKLIIVGFAEQSYGCDGEPEAVAAKPR